VVLEHHESSGAVLARDAVRLGQLLGGEVGAADRADLPLPHELVERPERLRDRRRGVGLVQVVEVDVVGPETSERAFDRRAYPDGRAVSGLLAPAELRREHRLGAAALEDLAEESLASP